MLVSLHLSDLSKGSEIGLNIIVQEESHFSKMDPSINGTSLVEEEIYPVYLLLELPTTDLLEAEKNLVKAFGTIFNRTCLSANNNLSVFYYEQGKTNGAESYHKTQAYMKIPHPNIWRIMEYLNNIFSDYDTEFQRLTNGLAYIPSFINHLLTSCQH